MENKVPILHTTNVQSAYKCDLIHFWIHTIMRSVNGPVVWIVGIVWITHEQNVLYLHFQNFIKWL